MSNSLSTYELIQKFFQSKTDQLLAVSNQAITEHSTLKGTHRENLIDIYLKEILPQKFAIDRGMVYGLINRSKESDLIIWDEQNFPNLKLLGHSMFFIESVKSIMEVKTRWSKREFNDIKEKKLALLKIHRLPQSPSLDVRIDLIENRIEAMENNDSIDGIISNPIPVPFTAFVFNGGEKFSIGAFSKDESEKVDASYPDLMILLKAGKVLEKQYILDKSVAPNGKAYLKLHEAGKDALLIFTSLLLEKLMINTNFSEYPVNFIKYGPPFYTHKITSIEIPVKGNFPGICKALKLDSTKKRQNHIN